MTSSVIMAPLATFGHQWRCTLCDDANNADAGKTTIRQVIVNFCQTSQKRNSCSFEEEWQDLVTMLNNGLTQHQVLQPTSMFLDMTDDGFWPATSIAYTADESQFSSKQLSSSIDGVGRCPLSLISKRVLFSLHVLIEQLLAVDLPVVKLAPSI